MKKLVIGLLVVSVLFVGAVYIFIPKQLKVATTKLVRANHNSVVRYFSTKQNWVNWHAEKNKVGADTANSFYLNGKHFIASNNLQNGLEITIQTTESNIESILSFFPINKDSTVIEWKCEINGGANPLLRFLNYRKAVGIKNNMTEILNRLHTFVENENNVYELNITHEIISDTLVISQKANFHAYPTTSEIYSLVEGLKKYALESDAIISGQPMMNVTLLPDSNYQTQLALPVNKRLPNHGNIESKNLTPGTPMLSSVVQGGNYTAAKALAALENYKLDHQFTSPAIPYYVLITDRTKETDSTKWKTKVCDLLFPWFK